MDFELRNIQLVFDNYCIQHCNLTIKRYDTLVECSIEFLLLTTNLFFRWLKFVLDFHFLQHIQLSGKCFAIV